MTRIFGLDIYASKIVPDICCHLFSRQVYTIRLGYSVNPGCHAPASQPIELPAPANGVYANSVWQTSFAWGEGRFHTAELLNIINEREICL